MVRVVVLIICLFISSAFSKDIQFLTETYFADGYWKVDTFQVEAGSLQTYLKTYSFPTKISAIQFANRKSTSGVKFALVATEAGTKPLWEVKEEWNEDWEEKYAQWVEDILDRDFFVKYNLATDCADVAYALRWIFARNNALPAAATLAGSGMIVSQLSAKQEWDNLPQGTEWFKDQRFIAGLNWLLENVYTGTLYKDAYPVAINRSTLVPGLINLLGGHTEIFSKVSYDSQNIPLEVVSSTVPRAVRELFTRPYLDQNPVSKDSGGLFRFRWPVKHQEAWSLLAKEEMPHYSLEQYDPKLCSDEDRFAFCIFKILGMNYSPELIAKKIQEGIFEAIKQRIKIVHDGYLFCSFNDCSPGTQAWEDWSTPTRDGRLYNAFREAIELSKQLNFEVEFTKWLQTTFVEMNGLRINYQDLARLFEVNLVSNDPRDSENSRWALDSEAIYKTLKRSHTEFLKNRTALIEAAEPCRESRKHCEQSSELIELYSTISLDLKMRTQIAGWWKFCRDRYCHVDKSFESQLEQVWRLSPAPWDSKEQRRGLPANGSHIIKGSTVKAAGTTFAIIDSRWLYNLKDHSYRELDSGQGILGYDKATKSILHLSNNTLSIYDETLKLTGTIRFEFGMDGFKMVPLGEGQYLCFVSEDVEMSDSNYIFNNELQILDLYSKRISKRIEATKILYDQNKPSNRALLIGQENYLVQAKNKTVSMTAIHYLPEDINGFLSFSENRFLLQRYYENQYSLMSVEDGRIKVLTEENDSLYYEFIFPNFVSVRGNSNLFLDSYFKKHFDGHQVLRGPQLDSHSDLIFVGEEGNWSGKVIRDSDILDSHLHFDTEWVNVLSAGKDWYSTEDYKIYAFSSELLEEHNFKLTAKCSVQYFRFRSHCIDPESKLLINIYESPIDSLPDIYLNVFGLSQGWQVQKPLIYSITRSTDQKADIPAFIDSGFGIKLEDGVILWQPN